MTQDRGALHSNHTSAVPKRFLLVDGYVDLLEALQLVLEARGHVVRTARSDASALAALETFSPDIVLLDAGLLAAGKSELLHELRRHPNAPCVRLIALSGGDEGTDRAHVQGRGFDGFLRKPFFVGDLLDELSSQARE